MQANIWWLLPGLLQRKHSKTAKLYHSEILHLATFQIYKDIRNIKGASGQAEPGQFQSPRGIPPRQPAPGVANYPPALVDPTQDPRGGGIADPAVVAGHCISPLGAGRGGNGSREKEQYISLLLMNGLLLKWIRRRIQFQTAFRWSRPKSRTQDEILPGHIIYRQEVLPAGMGYNCSGIAMLSQGCLTEISKKISLGWLSCPRITNVIPGIDLGGEHMDVHG